MASLICYGHEFEQTLAVGDGQGILAGCNPWGIGSKYTFYSITERTLNNWQNIPTYIRFANTLDNI